MRVHLFDEENKKINLMPWESCLSKAQINLQIVAPTSLPNKLESRDSMGYITPILVLQ